MIIKKIYSDPKIFDEVEFKLGINFIVGEKVEDSDKKSDEKTNGVGKTLLLDLIDFCLLSTSSVKKLSKIPGDILPETSNIILDIECNNSIVTIIRNIKDYKRPIINNMEFSKLEDAEKYLSNMIFGSDLVKSDISFRDMMSIYKRDEVTGYESTIKRGSNKDSIEPYLYLFNFDIILYKEIVGFYEKIKEFKSFKKILEKDIQQIDNITLDQAEQAINDLESKKIELENVIENLSENIQHKDVMMEIAELDNKIDNTTAEIIFLREELNKIATIIDSKENLDFNKIKKMYNHFKDNLGEKIVTDIKEIVNFKKQIDDFKNNITNQRKNELDDGLKNKQDYLSLLQKKYSEKLKIIDNTGNLRSLTGSIKQYTGISEEYSKISAIYRQYQEKDQMIDYLRETRDEKIKKLKTILVDKTADIESFAKCVRSLHKEIYGDEFASFHIKLLKTDKDRKHVLEFDLKTRNDSSGRGKNENALIFDYCLMFSDVTSDKHIKMIMHDSPFNYVNETTKHQSLNYLYSKLQTNNFQYILTINRDSFEGLEESGKFDFDISKLARARYDQSNRLFKAHFSPKNS